MSANVIAGGRFERDMADILSENGYWVLRVPQNAGGQQPADLVAVKGKYHALIDCKVVSGDRFSFKRIEDNQHYAMTKFQEIGGEVGWFAILTPDNTVRMLDMEMVRQLEDTGKHSLSVHDLPEYTWTVEDWLKRADGLCK